jgi:hypothetical protein
VGVSSEALELEIVAAFDNASVEIEGSAESLLELSEALRAVTKVATFPFITPASPPHPFEAYARSLRVVCSEGRLCVGKGEAEISIHGSSESLKILADNISFLAKQKTDDSPGHLKEHIHIEHYPDSPFLKEGSMPMVVTRLKRSAKDDGGRA